MSPKGEDNILKGREGIFVAFTPDNHLLNGSFLSVLLVLIRLWGTNECKVNNVTPQEGQLPLLRKEPQTEFLCVAGHLQL